MKKTFLALLTLSLGALASAQPSQAVTPGGPRSDEIMLKVQRLDVLIQVVPLALTKEQIPPLLSAIEKARQKEKELRAQEDKDLIKIEAKMSKAIDEGIEKDKYPPREVQTEVAATMRAMGLRRSLLYNDMVDLVYDACKKTLNEGQLKTMEKSLSPELLGSTTKGSEMDETAKIKFFIRKVILDPIAYDVLREMDKKRKTVSEG